MQEQIEEAARYEHGEGVPRDVARALGLYCQAAREGSAEAQYRMGWIYAMGRTGTREDALAAGLFAAAAEQGHEQAQAVRARMQSVTPALPPCMHAAAEAAERPAPVSAARLPQPPQFIRKMVERLAPRYAIDPHLALSVMAAESAFDVRAVSPRDARGLMQLLPETAQRFGVRDVFDAEQNLRGGLSYLRWLMTLFRGNVQRVLAAYNAGEQAVLRYDGVPPYAETRAYVARIHAWYPQRSHPYLRVASAALRPAPVRAPA
jgi:soluble lytic murein transglycosylase-like protein